MFQILKLLRQLGHRVTFIPDNLANEPPYTCELQKRGTEVVYHPYVKRVRDYLMAHGSQLRCSSAKPVRFCAQTHCRRSTARTTEPHHF